MESQLLCFPRRPYQPSLVSQFPNGLHTFRKQELDSNKFVMRTLRYDRDAMYYMNIEDSLDEMSRWACLNLSTLFYLPTHEELVKDFFSSLEFMKDGSRVVGWIFTIQGTKFRMSRKCASEQLGIEHGGGVPEYSDDERNSFWQEITNNDNVDNIFSPGSSPKLIKNDLWRYMHQLFAVNINSRYGGGASVITEDLDLMIAAASGEKFDLFEIITSRFKEMRNPNNGNFVLGCSSIITRIAMARGFTFHPSDGKVDVLDYHKMYTLDLLNITPPAEDMEVVKEVIHEEGPSSGRRRARGDFARLSLN